MRTSRLARTGLRSLICLLTIATNLSSRSSQPSFAVIVSLGCVGDYDVRWLGSLREKCLEGFDVRVSIYIPDSCDDTAAASIMPIMPCVLKLKHIKPQFPGHVFLTEILEQQDDLMDINIFLSSKWHQFSLDRLRLLWEERGAFDISRGVAEGKWLNTSTSDITFLRLTVHQHWTIGLDELEQLACHSDADSRELNTECSLDFDDLCDYLKRRMEYDEQRCLMYAANPTHDFATTKDAIRTMLVEYAPTMLREWNPSGNLASLPFPWSHALILSRLWEPFLDHHTTARLQRNRNEQVSYVPPLDAEHLLAKHFGQLVTPTTAAKLHQHDFRAPGRSLKIFVYDLPPGMHRDMTVSLTQYMLENGVGCGYNLGACTANGQLSEFAMAMDHGAEVVILMKFLMGADRGAFTADPAEADIFLVPLLGAGTICTHSRSGYSHLYNATTPTELARLLPHLDDPARRRRHVFLKTCESVLNFHAHGDHQILPPAWADFYGTNAEFLMIDLGFRARGNPLHIVVPPPILHLDVQRPTAAAGAEGSAGRDRDIFMFLFAGLRSPGLQSSVERNRIVRLVQAMQARQAELPLPLRAARLEVHLVGHSELSLSESGALMRRSVLCPCPPGDTPVTVRFFQAVLEGCIPVVLEYPSIVPGLTSWHCPYSAPWEDSLPFTSRIDYPRLTLAVPAQDSHDAVRFAARLAIPDEEVRARQAYLAEIRGLLMYDLSGQTSDAFSMILEQIVDALG